MVVDTLFVVINVIAASGWLALVFAPRWRVTQWLIETALLPMSIGLIYASLVVSGLGREGDGGMMSLDQIALLFEDRHNLLAGWSHFLAFDLFIGGWELRDSQRRGIHHGLVVPCLLMTLWLGPIGFLLYLVLRRIVGGAVRRGAAAENGEDQANPAHPGPGSR